MTRKNRTKKLTIAIFVFTFIVIFYLFSSGGARLDVTGAFEPSSCNVVRECTSTSDCEQICSEYTVCSVKTFEGRELACINGDVVGFILPQTQAENQDGQQNGGGSSQ